MVEWHIVLGDAVDPIDWFEDANADLSATGAAFAEESVVKTFAIADPIAHFVIT